MSEEFKHTPGPWHHGQKNKRSVFGKDGWRVADCGTAFSKSDDEMEANARLIAAAPDLLEALKELRDWYRENVGLPACKANAAIDKAEGRAE